MNRQQALVLGGGGARGALQVGAMRALYESGYRPDLVIGTSAGAINAAYVALHGYSPEGLDSLAAAWKEAAELELLPSNYLRLTLRAMLRPSPVNPASGIREFFISKGLVPGLRFGDLTGPRLLIVSSDLNTGTPVLHGEAAEDEVLDALLVSTALPPWVMPQRKKKQYLMDGALVSSLPIEPALQAGATEIMALDLMDAREPLGLSTGFGELINKMTYTVENRQLELELKLAEARGVPVNYVDLIPEGPVAIWDFGHAAELIERGYVVMKRSLAATGSGTLPVAAAP